MKTAVQPIRSIERQVASSGTCEPPRTEAEGWRVQADCPNGSSLGETAGLLEPCESSAPLPRVYVDGCESPPRASLSVRILTAISIFGVMYFAKAVLMPIAVALLMSLTLRPLVRRGQRAGVPQAVSATCILTGIVLLGLGAISSVLPPARQWAEATPANLQAIQEKISTLRPHWAMFSTATAKIRELSELATANPPVPVELHESVLTEHLSIVTNTGNALGAGVIVLVLVFFVLTSGDQLLNQVLAGLPRLSEKKRTVQLVHEVERGIATYLLTVTIINAGLGVVSGIGFWLMGMPSPILWGAMVFAFNYVPFFGPMVCSVILVLVSLLSFDSVAYACVPPLFFIAISAVEGNVLTPLVVGKSMSLNPIIVFVALILGGWAWGLGGAILAVPLLAVVKIATDRFQSTQTVSRILST